jgi:hypothetical protein
MGEEGSRKLHTRCVFSLGKYGVQLQDLKISFLKLWSNILFQTGHVLLIWWGAEFYDDLMSPHNIFETIFKHLELGWWIVACNGL